MSAIAQKIITQANYVTPNAVAFGAAGEPAQLVTAANPLPVLPGSAGMSLIERLNREGDPISYFHELSYTDFSAPTGAGTLGPDGFGNPVAPGRALFVQELSVYSTTPIAGRALFGGSQWNGAGTQITQDTGYVCGPDSGPARIPVNQFLRSSQKPYWLKNYIRRWLDPSVSGTHYVHAGLVAWYLADSINFEARKTMLMVGDSLWNGTGPSDATHCIPWLINDYYRAKGIDCRYILKAYSGSTTEGHEAFRRIGRYDFPRLDAIFYQLGTNDAQSAVATSTSLANAAAFVSWARLRHPAAAIVIFGPPPLADNDDEAALADLRAALSAHVAGLGDERVLFCDLGAAFDRGDSGNYAGDGVHPDDDGLDLIWQGGYGGFAGLEAWLDANLPEI